MGGPPRKTAPIYTVVIAAELLVADRDQGVVPRALAFTMLLMVWGRLCGRMTSSGWTGVALH